MDEGELSWSRVIERMMLPVPLNNVIKINIQSWWGGGSEVKNIYCSCRGPKLDFRHGCQAAHSHPWRLELHWSTCTLLPVFFQRGSKSMSYWYLFIVHIHIAKISCFKGTVPWYLIPLLVAHSHLLWSILGSRLNFHVGIHQRNALWLCFKAESWM